MIINISHFQCSNKNKSKSVAGSLIGFMGLRYSRSQKRSATEPIDPDDSPPAKLSRHAEVIAIDL